jgi:hypothetical protein
MSRGPGKVQQAILDRLSGRNCHVYANSGWWTTYELAEELRAAGTIPEKRQTSGYAVYRACLTLYHRGLLTAKPSSDPERYVRFTWIWALKGTPDPDAVNNARAPVQQQQQPLEADQHHEKPGA